MCSLSQMNFITPDSLLLLLPPCNMLPTDQPFTAVIFLDVKNNARLQVDSRGIKPHALPTHETSTFFHHRKLQHKVHRKLHHKLHHKLHRNTTYPWFHRHQVKVHLDVQYTLLKAVLEFISRNIHILMVCY